MGKAVADRFQALAEIRTYIGTPWVHQGRLKGKGVDCIGLVLALAQIAGLDPDALGIPADYGRFPHRGQLRRIIETHTTKVLLAEAKICDIALVAWETFPMHLIVLGNYEHDGLGTPFSAIHSENRLCSRVVESRFDSPNWALVGCYRLPGWD